MNVRFRGREGGLSRGWAAQEVVTQRHHSVCVFSRVNFISSSETAIYVKPVHRWDEQSRSLYHYPQTFVPNLMPVSSMRVRRKLDASVCTHLLVEALEVAGAGLSDSGTSRCRLPAGDAVKHPRTVQPPLQVRARSAEVRGRQRGQRSAERSEVSREVKGQQRSKVRGQSSEVS